MGKANQRVSCYAQTAAGVHWPCQCTPAQEKADVVAICNRETIEKSVLPVSDRTVGTCCL